MNEQRAAGPAPLAAGGNAPRVALGCALAALVAGVVTSCAVGVLSLSAGMISLAVAEAASRPIALVFVALELVALALAVAALAGSRRAPTRGLAVAAVALSAAGLLAAAGFAVFAPRAFHAALGAAADGASRVH